LGKTNSTKPPLLGIGVEIPHIVDPVDVRRIPQIFTLPLGQGGVHEDVGVDVGVVVPRFVILETVVLDVSFDDVVLFLPIAYPVQGFAQGNRHALGTQPEFLPLAFEHFPFRVDYAGQHFLSGGKKHDPNQDQDR
jgi:hypothetical protein